MMLDVNALLENMLEAASEVVKVHEWSRVKDYAEIEFKRLAELYALIERKTRHHTITPEEAMLYSDIAKNNVRSVLITIEGIGLIVAQQAIEAALDSVRTAVNGAIGFALL